MVSVVDRADCCVRERLALTAPLTTWVLPGSPSPVLGPPVCPPSSLPTESILHSWLKGWLASLCGLCGWELLCSPEMLLLGLYWSPVTGSVSSCLAVLASHWHWAGATPPFSQDGPFSLLHSPGSRSAPWSPLSLEVLIVRPVSCLPDYLVSSEFPVPSCWTAILAGYHTHWTRSAPQASMATCSSPVTEQHHPAWEDNRVAYRLDAVHSKTQGHSLQIQSMCGASEGSAGQCDPEEKSWRHYNACLQILLENSTARMEMNTQTERPGKPEAGTHSHQQRCQSYTLKSGPSTVCSITGFRNIAGP